MKSITCNACSRVSAMNQCFRVEGRELCADCAQAEVEARQDDPMPEGSVVRMTDPSSCARCDSDLDVEESFALGEAFVCATCNQALRNRPFPIWLRGAAVFIFAMVVVSFVYNLRFIQAHIELNRLARATAAGDIDRAVSLSAAAAAHVPESQWVVEHARHLAGYRSLGRIASLLAEDGKEQEVIEKVKQLLPDLPESLRRQAQLVSLTAEQGIAFNRKDYKAFIENAEEMAKILPDDPTTVAAQASAQALKYATGGDESSKAKALEFLEKLKRLEGGPNPRFVEFESRMNYRLETREIISPKEFKQRFPQGRTASKTEGAKK